MRLAYLCVLLVCLSLPTWCYSQTAVPVGQGSYASYPPAHEGEDAAYMQTRTIYTVDTNAFPIPTNDWWTDLLVSQYAGRMWAYPLAISADEAGVDVYFPTGFSGDGSRMQHGQPLQVRGKIDASMPGQNVVLADFESATYQAGWTTTGTAFGTGPAQGTLGGQSTVSGYLGNGLANSFLPGDGATGTLNSPEFTIDKPYLHFLIAGGNHPGETCVQLVVAGQVVRTATGDNSESLDWNTWDLTDLAGATGTIALIDSATGGWGHLCADHFVLSDDATNPVGQYGADFAPLDARAKEWSDWLVSFRMADGDGHGMDTTMGHGLPFVWFECDDLEPRIVSSTTARYFNESGTVTSFPITGDFLGIEYDGRLFGVYAPQDSVFDVGGDTLAVRFTGEGSYMVIGALPSEAHLASMRDYAYAIPRNTRLDGQYDVENGKIDTTWTISAEPLQGTNTAVLQGWLPHHYRTTANDLLFDGPQYVSPRGILKCASGNQATISYDFPGILPNLPAPTRLGNVDNDYDPNRMDLYLTMYAGTTSYGADTYWGGKDLVRLARYMAFADQAGDDQAFETLRQTLRTALEDWYTYSEDEEEHYFASYPRWGALVGFNESYYSYSFTDHHFHYGYYTMATALLGMFDEQFLADYGDMARLVAKEYANWDRSDDRFPLFRTFDPWRGHSYAGGLSSPNGNNQESSSEAIQSWAGLFLLGNVLGDDDMRAAGAMGYTFEVEAITEYWQDYYGYLGQEANLSEAYDHTITGILFDDGQAYATYFTGDPAWIYGIQWLPISPALNYLATDPVFAQWQLDQMWSAREPWLEAETEGDPNTISQMGTSLGNVVLGYAQLFNPDYVASQMDDLWAADDPVATDNYTGGITYYFTHANRMLGAVDYKKRINMPAAQVYANADRGETSYVAHNPENVHRLARVYDDSILAGYMHVPPRELVTATSLLIPDGSFTVMDTWPAKAEEDVPASRNEIAIIFSDPVDVSSLAGTTITGAGVSGLTFDSVSDDLVVTMAIDGVLQEGETYELIIPQSVTNAAGTTALGVNHQITFTTAEAIPDNPPAELIARYKLDETEGAIAADSSTFALHGTYVGEPGLGAQGAASGTGLSATFNGVDQEVSLGSPTQLSTLVNNFTISLWIRPSALGGNKIIFGARWHDQNGWSLRLTGNTVAIERLGPLQLYSSGTAVSANQWTHVVATYDDQNDVSFYINGQFAAQVAGDSPASIATEPWFIASNGTGERFAGGIDDLQIYKRVLSPEDVAFLFNNPGYTIDSRSSDLNSDGHLDQADVAALLNCLGGPGLSPTLDCSLADLDMDADVDLADFAGFQILFVSR